VYTVRAGGATWGSAFVAWVRQGKVSFVLTARAAVAGSAGDLFLKRDGQSLRARVVGGHAATGLALLRVNAALDRPLWRDAGDRGALRAKTTAVIVPAGRSGAFGEGKLSREPRRFSLEAGGGARYLGAPVLDENGQLAGIVVEQLASGESRIVPLADACGRIRACG